MNRRARAVLCCAAAALLSHQSDALASSDTAAVEVYCPVGWHPVGPLCTTIFRAPPYTECPTNTDIFKSVSPTMGGMWVYENGVCAWINVVSPVVVCPGPYEIQVSAADGGEPFLICVLADGVQHFAPHAADGSPDIAPEETSIMAENPPSPDAECPQDYTVELLPVNDYAWRHRQSFRCIKIYKFQGRLWCPDGWTPYGMEYTAMVVNSTLPTDVGGEHHDSTGETHDEHTGSTSPTGSGSSGGEHHRRRQLEGGDGHGDGHGDWWERYDWLLKNDEYIASLPDYLIQNLGGPSGCAQAVAVKHDHCDEFSCNTAYTKEQESVLRAWIVQKLGFLDEDAFVYESIPTGNDLKFTASSGEQHH